MRTFIAFFAFFACIAFPIWAAKQTGVLLVANSGISKEDREVLKIQKEIEKAGYPTAVSLNLADIRAIERAVKVLEAKGVKELVCVPLLVASRSGAYEQLEYLLGLRQEPSVGFLKGLKSQDLTSKKWGTRDSDEERKKKERFTIKMLWEKNKPKQTMTSSERSQLKTKLKTRLSPALNDHPYVAEIFLDRAKKLSQNPKKEVVVLVSQAPFGKSHQEAWEVQAGSVAHRLKELGGFFDAKAFSFRENSSDEDQKKVGIQKKKPSDLRFFVEQSGRADKKVIILPHAMSRDEFAKSITADLSGLFYKMGKEGLLTHPKIAKWVLEMAQEEGETSDKGERGEKGQK